MTASLPVRINTRLDRPEDNHLLFEIGRETFSEACGADNTAHDMQLYLEGSFGPEIQAAELASPSSLFLIAEIDDQPVGYARLLKGTPPPEIVGSRPIEIVRFYTRTPWIGRRVGGGLMEACLREARTRGCNTLWLGVWEKNGRAIAFYEKWGFQRVGAHDFLLGDDLQTDWLMQRLVGAPAPPGVDEAVRDSSRRSSDLEAPSTSR
jgi:GNAT superfamily N-acetyltransferase